MLPGLALPNVTTQGLREIWTESDAFRRFRGTQWMQEPCRSCDQREQDYGGCRCQAFLVTGDAAATDPVCPKSEHRGRIDAVLAGAQAERELAGRCDVPAQPLRFVPGATMLAGLVYRGDENSRALSARPGSC
jgi:pyrroloquinoline quinone biosynthesis protein E